MNNIDNISVHEIVMSFIYLNNQIKKNISSFENRINGAIDNVYGTMISYDIETKQVLITLIDDKNDIKYVSLFRQNDDILYSTNLLDNKYEIMLKIKNIVIECFKYIENICNISNDIENNFGYIKAINANYYIRFINDNIELVDGDNKEVKIISNVNINQYPITNSVLFKLDSLPISLQDNYKSYKNNVMNKVKNNWIKKLSLFK